MKHFSVIPSTIVFFGFFSAFGGELDRFMEWQRQRDYDIRRENRRQQMDSILDGYMDSALQSYKAKAVYAAQQAQQNPCFETEVALLQAIFDGEYMNFPNIAKEYFRRLRATCEKWGVEYDDTAEREYMERQNSSAENSCVRTMDGTFNFGPQRPHRSAKPSTKKVVDSAREGLKLASEIAASEDKNSNGGSECDSILVEPSTNNIAFISPAAPLVRPGQKHPVVGHVVLSSHMEWTPDSGYDWNLPAEKRVAEVDWVSFGVHWQPGIEHPEHPHVVAGDKEGTWRPENGWRFVSNQDDSWAVSPK